MFLDEPSRWTQVFPSTAWYVVSRTQHTGAEVMWVPWHLILYLELGIDETTSLTVVEVSPVEQRLAPWVTSPALHIPKH